MSATAATPAPPARRPPHSARYLVTIGGHSWARGPQIECDTITEGRRIDEEYGDTADWATITDRRGRVVASHQLDPSTRRWYKASLG